MNTIQCLIVDDEPNALKLIESYVAQTPFLSFAGKCNNAFEVMDFFQQGGKADVVFLDIQMPELNGMELSKTFPVTLKIIFTTAFEQFAVDGYKVNALDYLLKPFDYLEFLSAAQKAKDWFEQYGPANQSAQTSTDYFFIKSEYRQIKIRFDDIYYIEGLKDYAKIHLTVQPKQIMSLMSLRKMEEELPSDKFMRIHRSFIIALDKIDSIERGQVVIQNRRITIADQYKANFDIFLQKRSLK